MKETDCGDWTGQPLDELSKTDLWQQFQGCPSLFRFPCGESFAEIQARDVPVVDFIRLAHPEQSVAVFSHADPIKLAVAYYLGTSLDLFQRIEVYRLSPNWATCGRLWWRARPERLRPHCVIA